MRIQQKRVDPDDRRRGRLRGHRQGLRADARPLRHHRAGRARGAGSQEDEGDRDRGLRLARRDRPDLLRPPVLPRARPRRREALQAPLRGDARDRPRRDRERRHPLQAAARRRPPDGRPTLLGWRRWSSPTRSSTPRRSTSWRPSRRSRSTTASSTIAKQLVDSLAGPFDPDKYRDTYREEVLALVERKAQGEQIAVQPSAEEDEAPVPDLMSALKASLDAVKARDGDGGARRRSRAAKKPARRRSRRRRSPRRRRPPPRVSPRRRRVPGAVGHRHRRPPPSTQRRPAAARAALRRSNPARPATRAGAAARASCTSTRTARGSPTPRSSRGSRRSSSRRPGRDVWISPDPFGHIQATGLDQRGRKQYLYHPRWRERRDRQKFERHDRLRALAAGAARRSSSTTSRSATCRASRCSPAPRGCWTAASSGSARRSTRSPTRPTASRRCSSAT